MTGIRINDFPFRTTTPSSRNIRRKIYPLFINAIIMFIGFAIIIIRKGSIPLFQQFRSELIIAIRFFYTFINFLINCL